MVTARSSCGVPRIRWYRMTSAPYWLALLFLGFLCVHGSSDAMAVHPSSAAPSVNAAPHRLAHETIGNSAAPAVRTPQQECAHGAGNSPHPAEHCLPGQPDEAAVSAPCPRADEPSATARPHGDRPPVPGGAAQTHGTAAGPPTGVLRI